LLSDNVSRPNCNARQPTLTALKPN